MMRGICYERDFQKKEDCKKKKKEEALRATILSDLEHIGVELCVELNL